MRRRSLFLSYSRHDAGIAKQLAALLRVAGASVFRDEDSIQPGQRWASVIADSLDAADGVLVLWSVNSAGSIAVAEEYQSAIRNDKEVIPILLDQTPMPGDLRQFQAIDCSEFVTLQEAGVSGSVVGAAAGAAIGTLLTPITLVGGIFIGPVVGGAVGALLGSMGPGSRRYAIREEGESAVSALLATRVFGR